MWTSEIKNLSELKHLIVDSLNYEVQEGFSFNEVKPDMSFEEVKDKFGEPEICNIESDEQQTMQYNSFINHPIEGKRAHHKLSVLFWAFNRKPFKIIKIHFDYFKNGDYRKPFKDFIDDFINSIADKFGEPEKKSLRTGKEEISYKKGKEKLMIWRNSEGVRITIKKS